MRYNKPLHQFALFAAFCTFGLIIAGGLVTSTDSGLAVPDWPLSYGMLMPPMVGGIVYEHGHRMIAAAVGFFTTVLAVWLWRQEERRWVRILGLIALAAVVTQGILGGMTVLFLLPAAISVTHATLAQTFFSLIVSIALFTSRWWLSYDRKTPREENSPLLPLSLAAAVTIYVQLILGALMRHTNSGLVVPDFPLAYGQFFPSLSPAAMEAYNHQLIYSDIRLFADGLVTRDQILVHMLHRIWAFVVAAFIVWLSVRLLRSKRLPKRVRRFGYLNLTLLVSQIALGGLTVLSRKAADVSTAHVATGALLLATNVLLFLHLARIHSLSLEPIAMRREATA